MLSTSSSLAHPKMASNCKFGCCAGAEGIEKHMLTIRVWGTGHEQQSKDAEEGKERVEEEEWGGRRKAGCHNCGWRKCQAINTELVLQFQLQLAKMRFSPLHITQIWTCCCC